MYVCVRVCVIAINEKGCMNLKQFNKDKYSCDYNLQSKKK